MNGKDHNGSSSSNMEGFVFKKEVHESSEIKNKHHRILIVCTGNSCRSQMAEGWLHSFDERLQVFSAGTHPEKVVNPYAVAVMKEVDIDISRYCPKHVELYINDPFDFIITVCDHANEVCPVFTGNVNLRLHVGFEDPADAKGNSEEIMEFYRKVRDQIRDTFYNFLVEHIEK